MTDPQTLIKVFLLSLTLTACGTAKDSRYSSTEMLERPPILAVVKEPGYEETEVDQSVVPKRSAKKGLDDAVHLIASNPPVLKIKQPIEAAWHTLELALKQSEVKITDQEQKKGLFFVAYSPKTLADMIPFVNKNESKDVIYVLTVTAAGEETEVTSAIASPAEQKNLFLRTDDEDYKIDADDLLMQVFETLHDDLVEE